jgi:alpha-tubulin suppressor-like RCC1 family protein
MERRGVWVAVVLLAGLTGCGSGGEAAPGTSEGTADPGPALAASLVAPRLTARSGRTCHVLDDGRIRCWGDAALGQTGPTRWGDVEDAVQIVMVREAQCVLHRTHRVTCEGAEIGASAAQLATLGDVVMLAGAEDHFCALDDRGAVHCWGALHWMGARLSDGPVAIEGLPPSRQIAASSAHACALARDGSVRCWGRGFFGGLGRGSAADSDVPVRVDGVDDAIRIDASYDASCALGRGGALWCWGRGPVLGAEEAASVTRIADVVGAVDVDVNDVAVCVLAARGAVRCGTRAGLTRIEGLEDATEVELGSAHGCARSADDTVRCWGARDRGQLGEPVANPALPSPRPTATGIVRLQGGSELVLFAEDGTVLVSQLDGRLRTVTGARGADGYAEGPRERCWWRAGAVACEHSAMSETWSTSEPTPHPELGEVTELAFWAGGGCALAPAGTVMCWRSSPFMGPEVSAPPGLEPPLAWQGPGHDVPAFRARSVRALRGVAQLVGTADVLVARLSSREVRVGLESMRGLPELRGASAVVSAGHRACALREGRVACWGAEDEVIAPRFIDGVEHATQVSVNADHTCARVEDGRALCWGNNAVGALGDGTLEPRQGPVVVGGATPTTGVVAIAVVERSSCVLLEDHTVRCFGREDWVPPEEPSASAILVPAGLGGEAVSAPPTTHAGLGASGSGTGPSPTPLPQPGGCENLHVDATCTFASIDPIDPSTGAPAQAGSSPEAEQTYAIVYRLEPGAAVSEAALHVRGSVRDEAALRAHYEANVSARCSGEVLRAPCPPGVHVVPAVPPPPVGQLVRVP